MTLIAFALLFAAVLGGYLFNRMTAERSGRRRAPAFPERLPRHVFGAGRRVPGLFLLIVWLILQGPVTENLMMGGLPEGVLDGLDVGQVALIQSEIIQIANGDHLRHARTMEARRGRAAGRAQGRQRLADGGGRGASGASPRSSLRAAACRPTSAPATGSSAS
jgi:hypothetical protein